MEFNNTEAAEILEKAVKADRGFPIIWVERSYPLDIKEKHTHFQVELRNSYEEVGGFAVVHIEVPNHEVAIHLLKRFGVLTDNLIVHLKSSFTENKPKIMVISIFHSDWANEHANVKSYSMSEEINT